MPVKRQPDVKVIFISYETGTRDYVKFNNFLSCGINILLRKAMSIAVILYLTYINLKNIQSFHVLKS